ncbi:MAG: arsenate reductase [Cocleimonas sp.]|jgi:arsenate reductase
MIIMYGIKNCDTIKKARSFLEKNDISYEFKDFREDGVNPIQIRAWIKELGWDKVINKRSTTWRNLPDETKENMNETLAIIVAEDQPTIIKRPVLELPDKVLVGFSENSYMDNVK